MSTLTFRVSTRCSGRRRTVTVLVYDTADQVRAAAAAYTHRHGTGHEGEFARAAAVTHTAETITFDEGDTEPRRGTAAGIIRLARPHLGTSVIVHEVFHAACGIYRQDLLDQHGHVEDDMDSEELLAYILGDLTRRIVDRLYHYGAFAKPARDEP